MDDSLDTVKISAYVDGELNLAETLEIEQRLQTDEEAQAFALKMVSVRALLQASSGEVEKEQVPQDMLRQVYKQGGGWPSLSGLKRIAVALVIVLSVAAGYWGGEYTAQRQVAASRMSLIPPVVSEYQHIIDQTLENSKAGASIHRADASFRSVSVTPVQTYRGNNNTFYRLYRLQIIEGERSTSLLCLAYRVGKQRWQNQAVFYEAAPGRSI